MSSLVVARKDFRDAARSKMLWAIGALFVVFMAGMTYLTTAAFPDGPASNVFMLLGLPTMVLVPITALVAGYLSIAGERRSGSVKFLLGFPHSRADVVAGKLLGRTGVIAAGIAVGFLAATVAGLLLFDSLPLDTMVGFAGLTVLYGLAWVGLAVGVSAATASRGRAMAVALGGYLTLSLFWNALAAGVHYVVTGAVPSGVQAPTWYLFLKSLSPNEAYRTASGLLIDRPLGSLSIGQFRPEAMDATMAEQVGGAVPVYLQDWFGLVVLAAWVVVPAALGYLRFRDADL